MQNDFFTNCVAIVTAKSFAFVAWFTRFKVFAILHNVPFFTLLLCFRVNAPEYFLCFSVLVHLICLFNLKMIRWKLFMFL